MSIDKLIQELDKNMRDPFLLRECVEEIIGDYIGVSEAYLHLMSTVKHKPHELNCLCHIMEELTANLKTLSELLAFLNHEEFKISSVEFMAGKILHGEKNIDQWIERFEGAELSS